MRERMHVRKIGFVAGGLAVLLMGCGSDGGSAKVPNRDQLVAQIVESGGVSQAVAECSADALFSTLSKDDLAKAVGGGEPSNAGKDAFTSAILDCLEVSITVITDAPTTDAPTTDAPTTVAPTTVAPTTVAPTTVAPTTVAPTTVVAAPVAVQKGLPCFRVVELQVIPDCGYGVFT